MLRRLKAAWFAFMNADMVERWRYRDFVETNEAIRVTALDAGLW